MSIMASALYMGNTLLCTYTCSHIAIIAIGYYSGGSLMHEWQWYIYIYIYIIHSTARNNARIQFDENSLQTMFYKYDWF